MGREIIVTLLVIRPTGVQANDLAPQLVRDPQAFDRPQSRDPRRPERVFRFARGSPIPRDVASDLPRNHSLYSSASDCPRSGRLARLADSLSR